MKRSIIGCSSARVQGGFVIIASHSGNGSLNASPCRTNSESGSMSNAPTQRKPCRSICRISRPSPAHGSMNVCPGVKYDASGTVASYGVRYLSLARRLKSDRLATFNNLSACHPKGRESYPQEFQQGVTTIRIVHLQVNRLPTIHDICQCIVATHLCLSRYHPE